MDINFTLPDSAAALLRLSADRIRLATGEALTHDAIAKSLVLEVLIDDAEAHGIVTAAGRVS